MALTVSTPQGPQEPPGGPIAAFRVCRANDGRMVRDSDPEAAFVWYAAGSPIEAADRAEYRALAGPEDPPAESPKQAKAPTTKMASVSANKGA